MCVCACVCVRYLFDSVCAFVVSTRFGVFMCGSVCKNCARQKRNDTHTHLTTGGDAGELWRAVSAPAGVPGDL